MFVSRKNVFIKFEKNFVVKSPDIKVFDKVFAKQIYNPQSPRWVVAPRLTLKVHLMFFQTVLWVHLDTIVENQITSKKNIQRDPTNSCRWYYYFIIKQACCSSLRSQPHSCGSIRVPCIDIAIFFTKELKVQIETNLR